MSSVALKQIYVRDLTGRRIGLGDFTGAGLLLIFLRHLA
jgi:hypothetical protein